MLTTHATLSFAGHALHIVGFDPASLDEADLLWLPHHEQLRDAVRKRKAEHLAGRLAAVHALREYGYHMAPGIGERRQPLWPEGLYGSISHCATTALAVVSHRQVGVDIEQSFSQTLADELKSGIISSAEERIIQQSALPFALALTLAFSAKESAFKATPGLRQAGLGFTDFQLAAMRGNQMLLQSEAATYQVRWRQYAGQVLTLAAVEDILADGG